MNSVDEVLSGIATVETGGEKDPYNAIGKPTKTGDVALGKYQIMKSNIPAWSKEALGKEVTHDEFLKSPQIQDAVAKHQMSKILEKHEPVDAAKVWFGGEGALKNKSAKDVTGTTVEQYAQKFQQAYGGGYAPLPVNTKDDMLASGYNPETYQKKINESIQKGGNNLYEAYHSLYNTYAKTATPQQQSLDAYNTKQTKGNPVVKTVLHTADNLNGGIWDDFKNSFSNAITELEFHGKEAVLGLEKAVGLKSGAELKEETNKILRDKNYELLRITENAKKDPFSTLPDGSINWHGIASGFGGMLGMVTGFTPVMAVGGLVSLGTGGTAAPAVFAGLSAAELSGVGASALTMALDGYGSGYEEGLARGLSNDEAATLGAIRSGVFGTIGAIPGGMISRKLFGVAAKEITDKAIAKVVEGGLTKEAFNSVMPEMQDGIKSLLKRRLAQTGKVAVEEAGVMGGVMGTQALLDHIATVQYAQYANEQDKFRDVLDKTNEEIFKDVAKSSAMGAIMGGFMSLPALARSAAHPTMYGYIEDAVMTGKVDKISDLKTYIEDYGARTGNDTRDLSDAVDEMANVATTYGKLVPSPDARYQVFKLLGETKQVDSDIKYAQSQIEGLKQSGADAAIIEPDIKKWQEVIAANEEKKVVIDNAKKLIGNEKKPIEYGLNVSKPIKEINDRLAKTLNPEKYAVQEQGAEGVDVRQPSENGEKVAEGNQVEKPTAEGEGKKIGDIIGVPFTFEDFAGRLEIGESGNVELISASGKNVIDFGKLEDIKDKPISELNLTENDFDPFQLEQAKQKEEEAKPEEPSDLDKYFNEPKVEADEQLNTTADELNERLDESPETREEAETIISVADALTAKESTRRKRGKKTGKKTDESIGRKDSKNVSDVSETKADSGEGEQIAETQVGESDTGSTKEISKQTKPTAKELTPAIEVNGKVYEGANHGEAMDKAREAGEDVPDYRTPEGDKWRTENGKFKEQSTGEILSREQADAKYGVSRSDELGKEKQQAISSGEDWSRDVESTAKALEGKNIDEVVNKLVVPDLKETLDERIDNLVYKIPDKVSRWGIKNKQGYTYSSKKEASRVVEDGYNRDKYSIELSRKKQTQKSISEAYHKAKEDGNNPELVKAVEDLLGKQTEPTKESKAIPKTGGVVGGDNPALKEIGVEIKKDGTSEGFYKVYKDGKFVGLLGATSFEQARNKGQYFDEALMSDILTRMGIEHSKAVRNIQGENEFLTIRIKNSKAVEDLLGKPKEAQKGIKEAEVAETIPEKVQKDYTTETSPVKMPDGEDGLKVTIVKPDGEKVEIGNFYPEDVEKEVAKRVKGYKLSETERKPIDKKVEEKPIEEGEWTAPKAKGKEEAKNILIGKEIEFDYEGEKIKGKIDKIKEDGSYSVSDKEGYYYTVKHEKARFQVSGGKPIEKATAKLIDKTLKKAFPNIKTSFLSGEEFSKKHGTDALGVTNPDGTVDINLSKVTGQTQIHEMGHVWTSWAKKFAPKLYEAGMKLAEKETAIHDQLAKEGYDLEGKDLHEETLARMIGIEGERLVGDLKEPFTLSEKATQWVKDMWNKLSTYLKNRLGIKDTRFDGLETMTFGDFSAKVAKELISGKEISPLTSEEIASIESDGGSRFQYEPDESAFKTGRATVYVEPVSPVSSGIRQVLKFAKQEMGDATEVTREHVIKVADDIASKVGKYIEDAPNRLAGMNFIEDLQKDIRDNPEKFRSAIKELLEEHLAKKKTPRTKEELYTRGVGVAPPKEGEGKGTFSLDNLSKDAKNIILSIGDFNAAYDKYQTNKGRIITGNNTVDANPDATFSETVTEITPWVTKLKSFADKNKYTKKAFESTYEYILNTAHPQTWAIAGTGGKFGNLAKLARSIINADGNKYNISQTASEILKPVLDFANKLDDAELKDHIFNENETLTGAKFTERELFDIYRQLRQDHLSGQFTNKEGGVSEKGIKFRIEEREGRKGQTVTLYADDFTRLAEKFKEQEQMMIDSHDAAMKYLHELEKPVYQTLTGIAFPSSEKYSPLTNIAGNESAIKDYVKKHNFLGDVGSYKQRDKSLEAVYLVRNPIEVLNNRIEQGSKFTAYAYAIHNGDVLMGYTKDAYLNAGMKRQIEYWNKFKADLTNPEGTDRIESKIMGGFTISVLGLNPFVSLKHISTLPLASGVIPWKYLSTSLKEAPLTYADFVKNADIIRGKGTPKDYSPLIKEAMEHSNFFKMRMGANTSEIQDVASRLGKVRIPVGTDENGKWIYKELSGKEAMWGLKTFETSMGAVLWTGAKKMVANEYPHLAEGSKEYWTKVDELYSDAVIASQPSFSIGTKPAYMRGGFEEKRGVINKTLSLFAGQAFAQFNFMEQKGIELLNNPTPKNRLEYAKSFVNVFVVNAMLVGGINVLRQNAFGSKKKDTLEEAAIESAIGEIPIGGDILATLYTKIYHPDSGYDFNYPPLELINNSIKGLADAMNGKEERAVKEFTTTGAQILGIPLSPVKEVKAFYKAIEE